MWLKFSCLNVEFLPAYFNTTSGRINKGLNECGICESSDVPTRNMKHPIHIYMYIISVSK